MNILPQYIGVSKMSSWYPKCSGKESNLSSCLVQHRDMSVVCSAKRVIITCFPITMDPETDLPLFSTVKYPGYELEPQSCSGVGSNCALWGPQIQVVGVALIIEFCNHNYTFSKSCIL